MLLWQTDENVIEKIQRELNLYYKFCRNLKISFCTAESDG
jgi:hypothetical protein